MGPGPTLTIQQAIELGLAHHRDNRFAEAEAIYRQVLAAQPDQPDALNLLGALAHQHGRHDVAVELIGRAVAVNSAMPDFHNNLGEALRALGRLDEAAAAFRRALALRPFCANASSNLGAALVQLGDPDQAVAVCEQAVAQGADSPQLRNNLGIALKELGRSSDAIACFEALLARHPDFVEAQENLANALRQQGRIEEALGWLERALAARPDAPRLWRSYLSGLLYRAARDEAALYDAHLRFGRRFARPDDALTVPLHRDRDPERRLRVGVLSSDLRDHPTGRTMRHWFAHRDPRALALIAYSEVARPDAETAWFRRHCDEFHSTVGLSDQAVATMMRAHRIDILLIAAGHFDENRPTVAAWRAAPIQINAWDGATSGLAALDYALVDPIGSPPDSPERWVETRLYLPSFVVYDPPDDAPAVGPLPALAAGRVTFGSFNNPAKITPAVIALWSQVLAGVPDSRLTLKCANRYADPAVRERFRALFEAHGIAAERLDIRTRGTPRAEHLADYREIDIALDGFPFSGATTSFEALSMGVPVISLAGAGFIERMTAALLHAVGLEQLAVREPPDFVAQAVALAGDLPRLAALRAGLRARLSGSPVCDGAGQARALTALLRDVWRALPRPAP
jgi:protein O-GlcNAc transferase